MAQKVKKDLPLDDKKCDKDIDAVTGGMKMNPIGNAKDGAFSKTGITVKPNGVTIQPSGVTVKSDLKRR